MTEAAKILQMIETVAPDDVSMMDEIDARVYCYIDPFWQKNQFIRQKTNSSREFCNQYNVSLDWYPYYTRSRDALKDIRPEGYFLICNDQNDPEEFRCEFLASYKTPTIYAYAQTEELAELHAIIQAVAYVRGEK